MHRMIDRIENILTLGLFSVFSVIPNQIVNAKLIDNKKVEKWGKAKSNGRDWKDMKAWMTVMSNGNKIGTNIYRWDLENRSLAA